MPMPSTKTRPFFGGFLHEFLLFESAMTFEDIMTASLNIIVGQGNLKRQKFGQKLHKTAKKRPRFC